MIKRTYAAYNTFRREIKNGKTLQEIAAENDDTVDNVQSFLDEHHKKLLESKQKFREKHHAEILEKQKAFRDSNREKYNTNQRQYRHEHPDKFSEYNRKYRAEDPDRQKEYKARNREAIKVQRREYRKLHKDSILAYNREYTARNRERVNEWKRDAYWRQRPADIKPHQSRYEALIKQLLKDLGVKYKTEKRYQDCCDQRELPFDFYLVDYNVLIEVDGEQHFMPINFGGASQSEEEVMQQFLTTIKHDEMKTQYANKHGIPLIRIPYYIFQEDDWVNIIGSHIQTTIKNAS